MASARMRTALLVIVVAVSIAALESAGQVGRAWLAHEPASWSWRFSRTLVVWLTMAAATPLPLWMGSRFPLVRGRMVARVSLHLAAAVLFVAIHLTLDIAGQGFDFRQGPGTFARQFGFLLGTYLAVEIVIYAAVAGAVMYVRARREAEARARAAETLRAELGEARLAALQAQLAPHFLFNTLNAIATLALQGDGERVTRALGTLADLLRGVLDDGSGHEVPLEREMEFLDRYLSLQELRFGERLRVERSLAPETAAARVPRLLLQPLVENAVQHGLESTAGGTVTLVTRRAGSRLVIEVSDRGSGGEPAGTPHPSHGIGLANTRARLAQLYGEDQSLELLAHAGGMTVRVSLPFRNGARGAIP